MPVEKKRTSSRTVNRTGTMVTEKQGEYMES